MKKTGDRRSRYQGDGPNLFDAGPFLDTQLEPEQTSTKRPASQWIEYPPKGEAERRLDAAGRAYEFYIPPASEIEESFRHSGWSEARKRVRVALAASGAGEGRLERFDKCGSDCVVEVSADGSRHRVRACFCGDRFCTPCAVSRAYRARLALLRLAKNQRLRFITLTLKASDEPLTAVMLRLRKSFQKLRRSGLWRKSVNRGAAFVEMTRGRAGKHWHVHLHAIIGGSYMRKESLSEAWKWATGDSYIVDIRAVDNEADVLKYVTKYAAKGFDPSILEDRDRLVEAMIALRGSRMMMTFGAWYNRDGEDGAEEKVEWVRVDRLDAIISRARRGEAWAIGVCTALRYRPILESVPQNYAGSAEDVPISN